MENRPGSVLHFDCFSGISGDMTLAALLDLGVPESLIQQSLKSLDLPGTLQIERVIKKGIRSHAIRVETVPEKKHRHLSHILKILDQGQLTDGARSLATKMFTKLAEAEATVHGTTLEKVHFHEVGAVDSIFDFVGVAVGIDWLITERQCARFTATPVPTGCGTVWCDHGRMPIPAPATALLLRGIPLAACTIEGELTTPTGAAILATLVDEFLPQPVMTIDTIGYGAGTKDLAEQANVLRLLLGTAAPAPKSSSAPVAEGVESDLIWRLETNLDDQPAEYIGYCFERLFAVGAVDVFTLPIAMKKSRPGVMLVALCPDSALAAVEQTMFVETATLGIRKQQIERSILSRRAVEVVTPFGMVRGKVATLLGERLLRVEHDDCARLASEKGVPLRTVHRLAMAEMEKQHGSPALSSCERVTVTGAGDSN